MRSYDEMEGWERQAFNLYAALSFYYDADNWPEDWPSSVAAAREQARKFLDEFRAYSEASE